MADTGQIVAALAGGALLANCTMLLFKVRAIERKAEQRRRIDTAVAAVLAGVSTFRQDWQPDDTARGRDTPEPTAGAAIEVHARAHLRLIATQPVTKPSGRRDSLAPARRLTRPRSSQPRSRRR